MCLDACGVICAITLSTANCQTLDLFSGIVYSFLISSLFLHVHSYQIWGYIKFTQKVSYVPDGWTTSLASLFEQVWSEAREFPCKADIPGLETMFWGL